MNLLFRLIWVMLRARFGQKHAPLTEPRETRFTVWLTDQDMFMHMTNSRYLSFADLGQVDLSIRSGLRKALNRHGWRAEISGQTMTINRMLKAPKSFTLKTQIHGWDQNFFAVGQTFIRNGKIHATVNTVLQVQDKAGDQIDPAKVMELIAPNLQSPLIPRQLKDLMNQVNDPNSGTDLA